MAYNATALSAAIKSALEANIASMMTAIGNGEPGDMLQDFCDTVAGAVVDHLEAHPVVIPIGAVVVAATGGVPNAAPVPLQVT